MIKTLSTLIFSIFLTAFSIFSQVSPKATSAEERMEGYERRLAKSNHSYLLNLKFQSVGPTIMGGRVTDVEVSPTNPNEFYIAYASGGLFYTNNNGQSYTSLFDNEMVISIGDIAVDWKNDIIWIGSGENNSSRSSYSGFGMYKSLDKGKSWENLGLIESHHIGRIVLHPQNPNILWVAVLGHLYSSNQERGVFKTVDGGKSWKKVLYLDDNTGAIDMVINPANPDELFAAFWHRQRRSWDMVESGITSGIYKSDDGGETWKATTKEGSGFPTGDGIGRIGLAFSGKGEVLYAMLDNQNRRLDKKDKKEGLGKKELKVMNKETFLKLKDEEIKKYLEDNNFPKNLTTDTIKLLIKKDKIQPHHLADYLEDANADLFETEIVGAEVYKSEDGGKSWKKSHDDYLDDLVYTYGYYFGQIRVSQVNKDKIYIAGVPILKSDDGGKTFKSISGDNQHSDHHALYVSSTKEGHLINGNDGGINISYDDGANWLKVKSPPVGQFYTVNVDKEKPYNIYGGLQDNGVWFGPSTYKEGSAWENNGKYPYQHILGGDGFKVQIDTRDNKTIYSGFQFGHYYRFNRDGGRKINITPSHSLGESPLRFNWQTPIYLSRHNQDILYFGSNKFHRSMDKGNHYDLVSKDLTKGGKKGNVAYGTITTIHESDMKFGLIYLGTDDGLVYRSDDVGANWENISQGLPEDLWISGVEASLHDTARVYVVLNGYRWDDFNSYVYTSDNYGRTWKRIGLNLPLEPVNVIKEDPNNQNILYVGTDNGLYISSNKGVNFINLNINNGIPSVAVHDMVLHPRDHDLIVATHGRSIYKCDVTYLEKMTDSVMNKSIHLFKVPSVKYNPSWGKKYNKWEDAHKTNVEMALFVQKGGLYKFELKHKSGLTLFSQIDTLESGLNFHKFDLTFDESKLKNYQAILTKEKQEEELVKADDGKYYLRPGKYSIIWTSVEGKIESKEELNILNRDKK